MKLIIWEWFIVKIHKLLVLSILVAFVSYDYTKKKKKEWNLNNYT